MAPDASTVRHLPSASKLSMANPIGSIAAWQLAQAGFARCCASASLIGRTLPESLFSVASAGIFGGGGAGGAPSRLPRTYLPRSTGDVRFAYDVSVRMLECPSRPNPRRGLSVGIRHAAEVVPEHVRNAVMLCEPFVHERVVGSQQIDDAAVLAKHALQKQGGFAFEGVPQAEVEVRETVAGSASSRAHRADTTTARRNWSQAPRNAESRSIRRTC